jgi:hypothetical protein
LNFALFGEVDFLFQYSRILHQWVCELFVKMRVCEFIVVQNQANIEICCDVIVGVTPVAGS